MKNKIAFIMLGLLILTLASVSVEAKQIRHPLTPNHSYDALSDYQVEKLDSGDHFLCKPWERTVRRHMNNMYIWWKVCG